MESGKPQNTNRIIRETFYDMTLYLQTIFILYGIQDFLADDIISCLEDGYGKALQGLNKLEGKNGKVKIKSKAAVDRFLRKLEQEGI